MCSTIPNLVHTGRKNCVVRNTKKNLGKDVDLYISSTVRTMVEIWEGELELNTTQRKNLLKTNGNRQLVKTLSEWFGICLYANVKRGDPALKQVASDDLD